MDGYELLAPDGTFLLVKKISKSMWVPLPRDEQAREVLSASHAAVSSAPTSSKKRKRGSDEDDESVIDMEVEPSSEMGVGSSSDMGVGSSSDMGVGSSSEAEAELPTAKSQRRDPPSASTSTSPPTTPIGDLDSRSIHISTGLTAQVEVSPRSGDSTDIHQGELRYTPDQVWVDQIILGNQDRPDGRFGADQKSHTVAWTLVREALKGQGARPLSTVLEFFKAQLADLNHMGTKAQLKQSKQMRVFQYRAGQLANVAGPLPLHLWQPLVSHLITFYAQAYQASAAATYRDGEAKGKAEATSKSVLLREEKRTDPRKEVFLTSAAKLLDIKFNRSLGSDGYAVAVYHWFRVLEVVVPKLMQKYGSDLLKMTGDDYARRAKENLTDVISAEEFVHAEESADEAVSEDNENDEQPDEIMAGDSLPSSSITAGPVLTATDYRSQPFTRLLADHNLSTASQLTTDWDTSRPLSVPPSQRADISSAKRTDFASIVHLKPKSVRSDRKATVENPDPATYKPTDVTVASIFLSDRDRPKTRYGSEQKDHTVAWTLIRYSLMAQRGTSLETFLSYLKEKATNLKAPVYQGRGTSPENARTLTLATNVQQTIDNWKQTEQPLYMWQTIVSDVLRSYVIAYHASNSAAYAGDANKKNEGLARTQLYELEYHYQNGTAPDKEDVIEKARRLLDIEFKRSLTLINYARALEHWQVALRETFPGITQYVGTDLLKWKITVRVVKKQEERITHANIVDRHLGSDKTAEDVLNMYQKNPQKLTRVSEKIAREIEGMLTTSERVTRSKSKSLMW